MPLRPHLARAAALLAGCLLTVTVSAQVARAQSDNPGGATSPGVYLVTLAAPPAAAYDGGVAGLRATRPKPGARFDRTRPAVDAYRTRLLERQDALLRSVGDPEVLYSYTTALDGFAATLEPQQVRDLRAAPGVLRVERSLKQHVDEVTTGGTQGTTALPGMGGPEGLWSRVGGASRAGHGVVVGVVDSGVWPGNPSFDALPDPTPGTTGALPGFHGSCTAAERWLPQDCSEKIVSARWFVAGFGAENTASAEYLSPRDGSGHGSHVASTAVGGHGVRVSIAGQGFGRLSGVAPAARLAVYKACWTAPDPADDGCTTADTVAAVDRAVADGVDVLNYSVSGSTVRDDAVERAFLGAAEAGVFVAAAAGNDGSTPGSVHHVAPWVTTVAAATHPGFSGTVRLAGGPTFTGAMASGRRVADAQIVLGSDVAAAGASRAAARRCDSGALDTDTAEGTIVVCDRGGSARVDKSASVAFSGGVGMVLVNTRARSVEADVQSVPTVHLDRSQGRALKAALREAGPGATATLTSGGAATRRSRVAVFSGRGPSADSGVLKPDLTAPGVSVLGAVAPPSDSGRSWDLLSGTSTSAPHVAGLAAVAAGVHPRWSPAQIKSALMTTATDLSGTQGPLAEGAGHVDPTRLLDPGLVFDTDPSAWARVASGATPARAVNAASLAIGHLSRPTMLNRRVTNVAGQRESYSVRVRGLPDVDVQAFPATVRLAPGQSATVRLRVSARPSAEVGKTVTGWLVWSGDRHTVRVPVAVRPQG